MQAPANQVQQSVRVRLRIKSLDLEFKPPPKCSINLKLLSDGIKLCVTQAVGRDQPLHWEGLNPIDVDENGSLEIRVYELRWFGKKRERIGSVSFQVSEMTSAQANITAHDMSASPSFSATVVLDAIGDSYRAAQMAQKAASTALANSPNVLENMKRTRDAVDTIINVAQDLAELNPIIGDLVLTCKKAWETLNEQGQCSALVASLVTEMGDVLSYVAAVEDHAKIAKLRNTLKELLLLVEDASRFVIEYKSDGAAVRVFRTLTSSNPQDQVNEFVAEFRRLKEEFRTGMTTQLVQRVERLLDDADRALLEKLIVPGARYDPGRGCLKGTRLEILEDIRNWTRAATGPPALFWLYGPAGCGKSSVAVSISELLHEAGALAGSFFCKRDNEHLRKPENVISHLAASLAYKFPAYGRKLVEALRQDPELAHSATKTRFADLIIGPLKALGQRTDFSTRIVVVDAIDESGTSEGRAELVACLLELSKLASWLKVLITSRPNDEIRILLGSEREATKDYDLFKENKASVSRDIFAYIHSRICSIPPGATGRAQWPDESDIHRLSESANGLFIWARTACNLIQQNPNPGTALDQILAALDEGLANTSGGAKAVQLCVGAIILTGSRRPLPDAALAAMLSKHIQPFELSWVINRLGSVIYRDDLSAVRVLHQSFSDYMMDENCPEQYRIDPDAQNAEIAASCLEVMLQGLKFNICGLEDSCIMNRDVADLQTRIETNIHPVLMYSCVYWTTHLAVSPFTAVSSSTIELLDKLLCRQYLLYWIEALSLTDELHVTMRGMDQLINWINDTQSKYTIIAADMYRFISAAYVAISSSAPHLYVSALPFGAANYKTLKALKPCFPNTLSVTRGVNLWNVPCLRVINTEGPINCISISSDGRHIGSGSDDMTVRIWDAQTGVALLDPLRGHSDLVWSVAFSSDGQRIVSGSSDETVRIWNAQTGAVLLGPLRGHSNWVTSVAFSFDGRRIVSGSSDETVWIRNAQTGAALLDPLRGHSDSVWSVAFSSDSRRIVSGSSDKTVRIWDAQTGAAILHPLRGHSDSVMSVVFSSDGRHIVSGSGDITVRIWDAQTGAALLDPLRGHSDRVWSVAFSSDGQRIVSASRDGTVRIWDAQTGAALLDPLRGHSNSVWSVAFSSDGRRIVSGSSDETVRIWDAQTGAALLDPLPGHSSWVTSVAFSSDGLRIVSGSSDMTVRIWDVQTGAALLDPFRGHSDSVTSVAFSSDSRRIVSGSSDNTVRIWDAHTGAVLLGPLQGHSNWVMSVAFSSDGRRVLSGSGDNTVRIWDAQTGAALLDTLQSHFHSMTSVVFSSDGRRIVSVPSDETARMWDSQTGAAPLDPLPDHSSWMMSVAFSSDGLHIVSGSSDTTVRVWDTQTGAVLLDPLRGHSDSVTSVAFSSDSRRIVSGSSDETVRIWDAHTGAALLDPLQGHSGWVMSVSFSSDGLHIVSGSSDETVRIWDAHTGAALLDPLRGHSRSVMSVAFSSDGRRIVSGSSDNTVRIWDPFVPSSTFASADSFWDSSRLVSGGPSQLLHEGWVCGPSGQRVFWFPPAYQRKHIDHSLIAISTDPDDHPVVFDLSKLKVGTDWVDVIASSTIT